MKSRFRHQQSATTTMFEQTLAVAVTASVAVAVVGVVNTACCAHHWLDDGSVGM